VPKEYLHSAELRDIMQFGSSSAAVFFKMRVAGVLHIFQFETRQGEDICMALQTHINDIMMKRYSKNGSRGMNTGAPSSAAGGGGGSTAGGGGTSLSAAPSAAGGGGGGGPPPAGSQFGSKYEGHVAAVQKSLDEATRRIEALQKEADSLKYQKEAAAAEMEDLAEQLAREQAARAEAAERVAALTAQAESRRLSGAVAGAAAGGGDAATLAARGRELEAATAKVASLVEQARFRAPACLLLLLLLVARSLALLFPF